VTRGFENGRHPGAGAGRHCVLGTIEYPVISRLLAGCLGQRWKLRFVPTGRCCRVERNRANSSQEAARISTDPG